MSESKYGKAEPGHQSHPELESTKTKHFIYVGIGIVIVTIVLFFLLRAGMPLPVAASEQAATIDWLFTAHIILIALLFALVVVFMVYALVVFRRRKGDDGDGEHFEGNTTLEIAWTVIPLLVVFVFGYIGVVTLNDVTRARDGEMTVEVLGSQWTWTFTYPDTGVVTDELVLPVDAPALMHLEAADVVHSFWVPEFRVKQDLVPGQVQELRFTPTLEGDFDLVCAEMCGLNHYLMIKPVRIVSQAEYSAWMGEKMAEQGLQVASNQ
jgi:cytochrome c oxidase subunit 2